MKNFGISAGSITVRQSAAAFAAILAMPDAATAFTQSCSLLPSLSGWVFSALYIACAAALLGVAIVRRTGRWRRRSLIYPIWAAMLLFVLNVAIDQLWLDAIRQTQPFCH